MTEPVTTKLEEIYVDPAHVSARINYIDPDYVARLVDALADGIALPALRVAPIANPEIPEFGGHIQHTQQGSASRRKAAADDEYLNNPPLPRIALYDGFHTYWALVHAGVKSHPVIIDDQPVSTLRDLELRSLAANANNAKNLSDADLRSVVTRLLLGRDPFDKNEQWVGERGAKSRQEIAKTTGRSLAWVSNVFTAARVCHDINYDLSISRAIALARLPRDQWNKVFWEGDHLRLYILPGKVQTPRTIPEMRVVDLAKLIDRALKVVPQDEEAPVRLTAAPVVGAGVSVPQAEVVPLFNSHPNSALVASAPPETADDVATIADDEIAIDWAAQRNAVERLFVVASKLNNRQLLDTLAAVQPTWAATVAAYNELVKTATDRGITIGDGRLNRAPHTN